MLKSRIQEQGEKFRTVTEESQSQRMEGPPGKERTAESRERTEKVTEVLLVNSEGRPTKRRVTYQSWGEIGPDGPVHAVKGIQILIEENDGVSTYSQEDGPSIPPDFAHHLDAKMGAGVEEDWSKDAKDMTTMLPDDPVAIGDSWPLDMTAIAESEDFPPEIPILAGSGTGTIVSKELVDGREFLQIHIELTIPLESLGGISCRSDCTMFMRLALSAPVDGLHGDLKILRSMALKGEFEKDGEVMRMSMDAKEEQTQKRLK